LFSLIFGSQLGLEDLTTPTAQTTGSAVPAYQTPPSGERAPHQKRRRMTVSDAIVAPPEEDPTMMRILGTLDRLAASFAIIANSFAKRANST
jgi:hypothetical protein